MYNHWFVSRQKRQLTQILPALIAFNDICVGKVWSGNTALQIEYEDVLQERDISSHGSLRARRTGQGGGGIRTLFTQLKDLGLIFAEDETKVCRLTLIGEAIVKAEISFVDAMRLQLSRYQYPSATRLSGAGAVSEDFKVHPFIFLLRLLRDERLDSVLTMDEMTYIVIHKAKSDSTACLESIIKDILTLRITKTMPSDAPEDPKKTFSNIANTFFNYLSLTQYIDRGNTCIIVRKGKESEIDKLIDAPAKFIKFPEQPEIYQRNFGRGVSAKDLRDFSKVSKASKTEINEARIKSEYALLKLKMPITMIDGEVVDIISSKTGIDERFVERFLRKTFPRGSVDDFFLTYKEYALGGRAFATEFELATVEVFKRIFGMTAKHVGLLKNAPDVFVESDSEKCCGIIDNKAYEKGYSIIGDHKRRMTDEYIPNVARYGSARYPLAFFSYISSDFSSSINAQIKEIHDLTGVDGSAMPVDLMIDFAQDYASKGYTHKDIKRIFSAGKEITLSDI